MNMNDYQTNAHATSLYWKQVEARLGAYENNPQLFKELLFNTLTSALFEEGGELSSIIQRWVRDDNEADLYALKSELGDVYWVLNAIATYAGLRLSDVAQANLDKLASRRDRGVITGKGDNR